MLQWLFVGLFVGQRFTVARLIVDGLEQERQRFVQGTGHLEVSSPGEYSRAATLRIK